MTRYLYPQNLKTTAKLWLWRLKDFAICMIALLISVFALVNGFIPPMVATVCYGLLTICPNDTTILDYIRQLVTYFFTQQIYFWGEQ